MPPKGKHEWFLGVGTSGSDATVTSGRSVLCNAGPSYAASKVCVGSEGRLMLFGHGNSAAMSASPAVPPTMLKEMAGLVTR